ncbi:MAG: oligosaccharide flippase family protein [Candidatus Thiodiazotropha sp. (ex Lucina aurantia)]|nr:oligosaccharide flippase family protein [Candidatus Thiodiazotropha sp. (ex Lucina pensylvanica)]MBT3023148.1 oligosaccharide flippase family protein [Candidatus Thiodiazotropha taylori]MBT3049979.1 oligosaccharide flippase family protein [Candidatus Thiodiazotropha sp. (ex Codakia orbicularis)]MBV2102925.1 oligosaccharide flippase family protein [Candidatus Thiodiazotropha sp. (ex Lucina aurantia)]MBT3030488.1 oligosaccharide flippase family protein [Candidatus Thiodiazotropha sp. (ex Lucin
MINVSNRLISGGVWIGVLALLNAISTLLFNGLLARILSPEEVGQYFIAMGIAMLVATLSVVGTDNSIVRLISSSLSTKNRYMAKSYLFSSLLFCVFSSFIVMVGSLFLYFNIEKYVSAFSWDSNMILIVGVWAVVLIFRNIFTSIFKGLHELGFASLFSGFVTTFVAIIALFILYYYGDEYGLYDIVIVVIVCALLATIASATVLYRKIKHLYSSYEFRIIELLRLSAPLVFATAGFLVMREVHLWIVGAKVSSLEVAFLGAAIYLVQFITVPLRLTNTLIQPAAAHLYARGKVDRLQVLLRGTGMVIVVFGIAACFLLLAFGEVLLSIVYGEKYTYAVDGLNIIILGQLINVAVGSPGVVLTMAGYEKLVMISSLSAAGIGITTTYILSESMGYLGGAIGFAVTFASYNLLMWIICLVHLKIITHAGQNELLIMINEMKTKIMNSI